MFTSRSLPYLELARLTRSRRTRIALLAVLAVPLLAGQLQTSNDAGGDVSTIRAAIVNHDKIVTATDADGEESPVAVGRLLAAQLTMDDSADNFDWVITQPKDARAGLKDGTYGAVLTIPEGLSAAAISTAGKNPEQGTLNIETNDATSYLNGRIASDVGRATTSTLNSFVTATYLDNLYVGFATIKSSVGEAADGAGQLRSGATQLADGTAQLSGGLGLLNDQTQTFPNDAAKLDAGVAQLDSGASELDSGVGQLRKGSTQLADGSKQLANGMDELVARCPGLIIFQSYCDGVAQARDGAKQVAAGADELDRGVGDLKGGTSQLASGTGILHEGTRELAGQAPQLADAISQASAGARLIQSGTDQLADGSKELADGLEEGAAQVPSYSDGERTQLSKVVASPVTSAADRLNPVESAADSRIPFVLAVALFLGALATFMLLTPLGARPLASALPGWRATFTGYLPATLLAGGQVAAILMIFALTDRLGLAQPTRFIVTAVVVAWTFTALVQGLVALWGRGGVFAGAAWLFVQASLSDPSQPAGRLPAVLDMVHTLSPLTPAIDGLQAAQTGGGSVATPIIILFIWLAIGLLATTVAAYRERTVSLSQVQLIN